MTSRSESFAHRAFLSEKKVGGGTHAARYKYRLIWKGARRAFAMYQNRALLSINHMRLTLCDVVPDIIDQRQLDARSEDPLERAASGMADALSIRPCEIRGRGHGLQIPFAFRRLNRRAGKLAVGNVDVVPAHGFIQL